jgi:hypothetical protein
MGPVGLRVSYRLLRIGALASEAHKLIIANALAGERCRADQAGVLPCNASAARAASTSPQREGPSEPNVARNALRCSVFSSSAVSNAWATGCHCSVVEILRS